MPSLITNKIGLPAKILEDKISVGLVVDAGTDLPEEIIERNQMEVVPFKLDWPEIQDLPGENIYQKMREAERRGIKTFGKTSQPSPKDFLDAFEKQLGKFGKIICITITSKHSGTYNSAIQARNFLEEDYNPPTTLPLAKGEWAPKQKRVYVVDSLNASGGEGLLVLKAIDLISEGKIETEEIIKELEEFRSKIYLRVIFKDPKWIEASGRISHTLADWVRKIEKIGIRPLLGIKKGVITAVGIKTGAKDMAGALFREIEEKTRKLRREGKKIRIAITHGDNLAGVQKMEEMIKNNLKEVEISFVNLVNNIVGSLAGPDALAVAWSER